VAVHRSPLNDGWTVRPKQNPFAERVGMGMLSEPVPVTLPHDALIGADRSPSGNAATAYFQSGIWEYRRTLEVPAHGSGTSVFLEFDGIYRDAFVYVNGDLAVHRPSGYSDFVVEID